MRRQVPVEEMLALTVKIKNPATPMAEARRIAKKLGMDEAALKDLREEGRKEAKAVKE